jgi:hypothetical protein
MNVVALTYLNESNIDIHAEFCVIFGKRGLKMPTHKNWFPEFWKQQENGILYVSNFEISVYICILIFQHTHILKFCTQLMERWCILITFLNTSNMKSRGIVKFTHLKTLRCTI